MKTIHSKIAVVITAAGSSTRMGGTTKKEYLSYNDGTVLSNCAKTFLKALLPFKAITDLIITYPATGLESDAKNAVFCDKEVLRLIEENNLNVSFVPGAQTRQASVLNGLKQINQNASLPDIVLIHDGARPFVTESVIFAVIDAVEEYGASVPGITPTDTQKELDENGFIKRHLVRSNLSAVQTPQGFNFQKILAAHLQALSDKIEYTDDTEIWGNYCGAVKVVPGDSSNIKITYPEDLYKLSK